MRGLKRCFQRRSALSLQIFGKFDNQNRIFRTQTHHGNQADLEVYTIIVTAQPHAGYHTQHAQRHHQNHRHRNRPALIKRSQSQEHGNCGKGVEHHGLRAALDFFARLAGPFQAVSAAQVIHQALHFVHGITRRIAFGRCAGELHGRIAVETLALLHTIFPSHSSNGGKRHSHTAAVGHSQRQDVCRLHARRGFCLHNHPLQTALIGEVVYIGRAQSRSQRGLNAGKADALRGSGLAVDVDFQLRRIFQAGRAHIFQNRALAHFAEQLIALSQQSLVAAAVAVLQIHGEARVVAQFTDGRRVDHNGIAIFNRAHQSTGHLAGQRHRIAACIRALRPIFQHNKAQSHILAGT